MKQIIAILFITLFICPICSVSAVLHEPDQTSTSDGYIMFSTAGPIAKRFTTITFENGSQDDIEIIQRTIDRKVLQLVLPIQVVPVDHLDFSITYERTILLPRSAKAYYTSVGYYENGTIFNSTTIINQKHTIVVEDFAGYFLFSKSHPFRIGKDTQAKFMFVGSCEHILVLN